MKKRILIATSLLVILIIGSISVYATSFESNIDIMEKVGQLFKSHKEKSDNSIFAKGKSGGIITKDDIEKLPEEIKSAVSYFFAVGFFDRKHLNKDSFKAYSFRIN